MNFIKYLKNLLFWNKMVEKRRASDEENEEPSCSPSAVLEKTVEEEKILTWKDLVFFNDMNVENMSVKMRDLNKTIVIPCLRKADQSDELDFEAYNMFNHNNWCYWYGREMTCAHKTCSDTVAIINKQTKDGAYLVDAGNVVQQDATRMVTVIKEMVSDTLSYLKFKHVRTIEKQVKERKIAVPAVKKQKVERINVIPLRAIRLILHCYNIVYHQIMTINTAFLASVREDEDQTNSDKVNLRISAGTFLDVGMVKVPISDYFLDNSELTDKGLGFLQPYGKLREQGIFIKDALLRNGVVQFYNQEAIVLSRHTTFFQFLISDPENDRESGKPVPTKDDLTEIYPHDNFIQCWKLEFKENMLSAEKYNRMITMLNMLHMMVYHQPDRKVYYIRGPAGINVESAVNDMMASFVVSKTSFVLSTEAKGVKSCTDLALFMPTISSFKPSHCDEGDDIRAVKCFFDLRYLSNGMLKELDKFLISMNFMISGMSIKTGMDMTMEELQTEKKRRPNGQFAALDLSNEHVVDFLSTTRFLQIDFTIAFRDAIVFNNINDLLRQNQFYPSELTFFDIVYFLGL